MKLKHILDHTLLTSIAALIVTALFVAREYFNGGVITHHLLADKDMPGLSNWWGLLSITALTWIAVSLIKQRQNKATSLQADPEKNESPVFLRFFIALGFGILITILWEFRIESILPFVILLPVVVALFKPVHFPECLLGLVLGMMYAFGGILPIMAGIVLLLLSWVANKVVRRAVLFVFSKFI